MGEKNSPDQTQPSASSYAIFKWALFNDSMWFRFRCVCASSGESLATMPKMGSFIYEKREEEFFTSTFVSPTHQRVVLCHPIPDSSHNLPPAAVCTHRAEGGRSEKSINGINKTTQKAINFPSCSLFFSQNHFMGFSTQVSFGCALFEWVIAHAHNRRHFLFREQRAMQNDNKVAQI